MGKWCAALTTNPPYLYVFWEAYLLTEAGDTITTEDGFALELE